MFLGTDLIPGAPDNPDGFWEYREIVRLHEMTLFRMGSAWTGPRGHLPIVENWWLKRQHQATARKLESMCLELCDEAGQDLPAFKDPRTAGFLPFWMDVFQRHEISPVFLIAVRHPVSVSQSLARRNHMGLKRSELLWLRHYLASLKHSRGFPALVIDYDRWFHDTEAQAGQLYRFLPNMRLPFEDFLQSVRGIISPDQNHGISDSGPAVLPHSAQLYSSLLAASRDGRCGLDVDHAAIEAALPELRKTLK